ncbi:MAG TPA: hypothetical protein VGP05_10865 [Pseudonocardia sp.]|nr:hypothetical protein [Pseudonocardia sp.]
MVGLPGAPRPLLTGALGWARTESSSDGDWMVRTIPGVQGRKSYRCPGCDHEIAPGVGHLVVWPAGLGLEAEHDGAPGSETSTEYGDADQRRHWHTTCWAARHRRRPGRRAAR